MIDVDQCIATAQQGGCRESLLAAVDALRQVRAWCDAQELRLLTELEGLTYGAPEALADAGRVSHADTDLVAKRARTVEQIPALHDALVAGVISGRHIDAAGRVLRSLEAVHRGVFAERVTALIDVAESSTPADWARRLRSEASRVRADGGMPRLEQQRRNTRLRTWTDLETGMWHLAGAFDPVTGAQLDQLLKTTVNRLFADGIPDTAPTDLFQRQDHLRALALVELVNSPASSGVGRLQASVAIDFTQLTEDGQPLIDWGLPIDIPTAVLHELLATAEINPVIIRDGVIVWAPGQLNQGRSTRLANKAQRRALRARYPRCVVHGCHVHYLNCKIHHLIWWRHGGPTNLNNLAPVCTKHHAAIHNGELVITRNADWSFTTSYRTQRPPGTTTAA